MINIVIDTNILVSAALSPEGNPAKIIALLAENIQIQIFCASDILAEYDRVLSYEKLKISSAKKDRLINLIQKIGIFIKPPASITPMPDESDRIFYDTAKASGAVLITGNIKHYPVEPFIMSPTDFLLKL